jgi:type I pantothenate kinase
MRSFREEAVNIATSLWNEINLLNLKNILQPKRASLIMTKSANHSVNQVRLRK